MVGKSYQLFQPLSIRFFDGLNTIEKETTDFTFDQWYLANQLSTLKSYKTGFNQDKFEFRIPTDISFYKNYEKAFQQLVEAANGEEVLVYKESKESIQTLVDKQLVIGVYYDNDWAGFIAVDQINYKYFKGYCVMEEILLKEYKGKGLGKALQRKMIEHLSSKDDELLYGTIDNKNIPSIKTALANGRLKTGKYVFCKINQ
ncbi:MAG: GNAT family N-acetyltransferase [Chitinophagales bacterium]